MRKTSTSLLMKDSVFAWIAIGTVLVLLILFVLQLTVGSGVDGQGFNWNLADFVVMGILLSGISSLYVLVSRKVSPKYHVFGAIFFLVAFLWLWAELAVGVFTSWGD